MLARTRQFASPTIAPLLACVLALLCGGTAAKAQTLAPAFINDYMVVDLGTPAGVPASLGGLTLSAGDPNLLLITGSAANASARIYSIGVTRDAQGHINGFVPGSTALFATAPGGNGGGADGGLAYGPGGVLFYTSYIDNYLGQIKPGSAAPDKLIDLAPFGVVASVGTLNFVPAGFSNAGDVLIGSYGGVLYSAELAPDASGTFNLTNVNSLGSFPGGPEGIVHVPTNSPVFTSPTLLISEYAANQVSAYDLDAAGLPVQATRRAFITNISGAEGAFIDPLTGDFLFSTFGAGDRVLAVRGFAAVPEPCSLALLGIAASGGAVYAWRRRKRAAI